MRSLAFTKTQYRNKNRDLQTIKIVYSYLQSRSHLTLHNVLKLPLFWDITTARLGTVICVKFCRLEEIQIYMARHVICKFKHAHSDKILLSLFVIIKLCKRRGQDKKSWQFFSQLQYGRNVPQFSIWCHLKLAFYYQISSTNSLNTYIICLQP